MFPCSYFILVDPQLELILFIYLFIYLFLPPSLNPKSYGRARVLEAPGPSRPMLVIRQVGVDTISVYIYYVHKAWKDLFKEFKRNTSNITKV